MIDRTKLNDLLCVLSTLHEDRLPQSAVVGFTETPELTFIIGTSNQSRKAENIKRNDRISLVIGWDERITLQVEGTARILSKDEAAQYYDTVAYKNPISAKYFDSPDQVHIMIHPGWMRHTDLNVYPWEVVEEAF